MTSVHDDPMAAHLAATIERCGWAVAAIGTGRCDEPGCDGGGRDDPFAYTVGLHARGLPELIVRGLDAPTGQSVLNAAARRLVDGSEVRPGDHVKAGGRTWTVALGTTEDRADVRYARAFARGSGRRLATPWRLDETGSADGHERFRAAS